MKSQSLKQHFVPNMATLIAVAMMFLAYHAYTVWAMPNAQGSIPAFIPYQGTLTDASGNPIEGNTNLTFRLYNTASGGTALWTESHTNVPVSNGLFRVNLGSKTAIPSSVWSNGALYLGITIGSEAEMTPREAIGAAPFAWVAGYVALPSTHQFIRDQSTTVPVNPDSVHIGTAQIVLSQPGKIYVQCNISLKPVTTSQSWISLRSALKKGSQYTYLADHTYSATTSNGYTNISLAGIIEVTEAGTWTPQCQLARSSEGPDPVIHTYSITAFQVE